MIQIHGLETHHGDGKQILRNKQFHKGRRIGKKRYFIIWGLPHSSIGKESAYSVGDPGLIPGSGRFLEKEMVAHSSILA